MTSSPSAVVLGLDGATLQLIEPWVAAGELPNLGALMGAGSRGKLRSTLPAVTPLAWPSIYTGTNPGKHGMFGFVQREPDSYHWRLNSSADMARPAVWDILGANGLRSAVLFAPFTHPARPIEGTMVAGVFGPKTVAARSTHPAGLADELAGRFDGEKLYGTRKIPGVNGRMVADRLVDGINEQTNAMLYALQRDSFDFVFCVWFDTDRAAHLFWHHSDLPCPDVDSPMFRVYAAVDEGIGRVLEALGGDPLVLVCSDHGTHPIVHRINTHLWLQQHGLLELTASPRVRAVSLARSVWLKLPRGLQALVPLSARAGIRRSAEESVIKQQAFVDWERTKVYPQPVSAEALFVNLAGREPAGTVAPGARADVVERLCMHLEELTAPDGTRLVVDAVRNADIYQGPFATEGPDVVADTIPGVMFAPTPWADGGLVSTPERPDLQEGQPRAVGYHQRNGMVMLSGPGVRRGVEVSGDIVDIAPTVLRYLGVPCPRDLDGRGLEEAFDALAPASVSAVDIAPPPSQRLDQEEEALLARQLKDLGYIE